MSVNVIAYAYCVAEINWCLESLPHQEEAVHGYSGIEDRHESEMLNFLQYDQWISCRGVGLLAGGRRPHEINIVVIRVSNDGEK